MAKTYLTEPARLAVLPFTRHTTVLFITAECRFQHGRELCERHNFYNKEFTLTTSLLTTNYELQGSLSFEHILRFKIEVNIGISSHIVINYIIVYINKQHK